MLRISSEQVTPHEPSLTHCVLGEKTCALVSVCTAGHRMTGGIRDEVVLTTHKGRRENASPASRAFEEWLAEPADREKEELEYVGVPQARAAHVYFQAAQGAASTALARLRAR